MFFRCRDPEKRLGYKTGAKEIKKAAFFEGLNWDQIRHMVRRPLLSAAWRHAGGNGHPRAWRWRPMMHLSFQQHTLFYISVSTSLACDWGGGALICARGFFVSVGLWVGMVGHEQGFCNLLGRNLTLKSNAAVFPNCFGVHPDI